MGESDNPIIADCVRHAFATAFQKAKSEIDDHNLAALNEFAAEGARLIDCLLASLYLADSTPELETLRSRVARLIENSSRNPSVRRRVFEMHDGHCHYCDRKIATDQNCEDGASIMHIDHIVSRQSGGPDHISNFVPSCGPCNTAKGTRHYVEFMAAINRRRR